MEDEIDRNDDEADSYEHPPLIIQPVNPQLVTPLIATTGVGDAGDPAVHQIEGARNVETEPTHGPRDVNAVLMTILTAVIAVATAINVGLFYMESESTSAN